MTTRSQSEADKVAAAGFAEVYEPVKPYLDDLDVYLQSQVAELEPEIREHVRYVFGHSGKRLRPMLVAYSGWEGPGADRKDALVKLGSVIELVHLATLVHDDILDEAEESFDVDVKAMVPQGLQLVVVRAYDAAGNRIERTVSTK